MGLCLFQAADYVQNRLHWGAILAQERMERDAGHLQDMADFVVLGRFAIQRMAEGQDSLDVRNVG